MIRVSSWLSKAPLWTKVQAAVTGVLVKVAVAGGGAILVNVGVEVGLVVAEAEAVGGFVRVLMSVTVGVSEAAGVGVRV